LDRLSLAKELDKRAQTLNIQVPCFLQVNVSGESSKFGVDPESLENFAKKISDFSHLQIIGLMTMAPHEEDPEKTRPVFRGLRQLLEQLNQKKILKQPLTELSMGMSNDFEIAIEEGATWIRLGSVLVGKEI
jgi:pyridoxal phosphate enzyme (YggS family)